MTVFSRRLPKFLAVIGAATMLACLGACGGGGSSTASNGSNGGGGGGGGTVTSSSITLPSNVQVVTAH